MNAIATTLTLTHDLLTGMQGSPAQVRALFHLASDIKAPPDRYRGALEGKFLAMIFEKPSLRTRVTFEVGIASLGGRAVFLDHTSARLGERVFSQQSLDELAAHGRIPVINALSDRFHPCQALADFFTLEERFGGLRGLKFAYVGDGNNVCHSLLTIGARAGAHVRLATPAGYEPDSTIVAEAKRVARETRGKIEIMRSAEDAVAGAQAIYTDVWASMGQEGESAAREVAFAAYQVNEALM